jgi:parallel beta-helix repeat protein
VSTLKRFTSTTVLLIILCLGLLSFSGIYTVRAEGAIHIKADGSVDGTSAIQHDGNVYAFTANIDNAYGIIAEKDNIIIDCAGYALQGAGEGTGLDITYRTNVTIKNAQIINFLYGIVLDGSLNCLVYGNTLRNRVCGIWLYRSQNTSLNQNEISESGDSGIQIDQASGNTISENIITNNTIGIWINGAANTTFYANNITDSILYGIMFSQAYASTGNLFYGNNFVNNPQQVVTYGQRSAWDNGVKGNYWSDYAENDLNHDGIGDAPYAIDANKTDQNPLTNPVVIPEFPQWIILPLLTLATIFAIITKKKAPRQFHHSP